MLTLFFTIFSTISFSYAQSTTGPVLRFAPQPPHESQFQIQGEFEFLSSGANYLNGSGTNSFVNGGRFDTYTGMGQFTYDFNSQWRAFAGLSGGEASVNLINQAYSGLGNTVTYNQTVTGVNDAWVGGQFWYRLGNYFSIIPEAEFLYPFFRIDPNSTNTLYGEGAMEIKAGSWVEYRYHDLEAHGYAAYDYRDQGRSALIPYDLGTRWSRYNSWWTELDFHGFGSVSSDANSAYRVGRENYLTEIEGGSYEYYAINPSRANIGISGGLDFDGIGLYLAFDFTALGQESANYWSAVAGLTFNGSFGAGPHRRQDGFSPKPESYDSSLFQENAVPKEPVDPNNADVVAPEPQPHAHKAKNNSGPEPSVELLMKDTEQTLDTKTK